MVQTRISVINIDKEKKKEQSTSGISASENKDINIEANESSIYEMQNQKQYDEIKLDKDLISQEVKITGLFDPEDYGLDIYMWTNSDGNQLKDLFTRLSKIKLSKDASELMNISILTNAYYPQKNISEKEFLGFKEIPYFLHLRNTCLR